MKDYYFPEQKTADEWRKLAHSNIEQGEASFERCDTDGFLSQWASGQMARLYDALADLADNGGNWELPVLEDLDGKEVNAKIIHTRYGTKWGVIGEDGKIVKWLTYRPARKSTLEKHGYRESTRIKPAIVHTYDAGYNVGIEYIARK